MAGLAGTMTARAERHRERIARLLDQVQSAADAWVRATYACGVGEGKLIRPLPGGDFSTTRRAPGGLKPPRSR
jgi:hypothetical protein